jgi:PIN domain nuclease of toxin-antitoxin system
MAFLLDTHTFLWFAEGNRQIPDSVRRIISDSKTTCFISIASFWEITIKIKLGKLDLGFNLEELFRFAERNEIEIVPINEFHLLALQKLEYINRDPFDRVIVAQAISENLTLLSGDQILKGYPVAFFWD